MLKEDHYDNLDFHSRTENTLGWLVGRITSEVLRELMASYTAKLVGMMMS